MSDQLPPAITPPPPDALKRRLGAITPVRTRRPELAFGAVLLIALGWGASTFLVHAVRPDLPWLPTWWVVLVGAAWLVGFVVSLRTAIVPLRGQVLPDGRWAERAAWFAVAVALAVSAWLTRDAPGHSLVPAPGEFMRVTWHCIRFELLVCAGVTAIVLVALRRMWSYVSYRTGMAIGAAGGALGGLALHFLCPYATTAHVTAGHALGVIVCLLLGAGLARLFLGRSNETGRPAGT